MKCDFCGWRSTEGGNGQVFVYIVDGTPVSINMLFEEEEGELKKLVSVACPLNSKYSKYVRPFMKNALINDFEIERDDEGEIKGAHAVYENDMAKVAKVVSYLLASVYRIPLDAELEFAEMN